MNPLTLLKVAAFMLAAPIRIRRHPPLPPAGRDHYESSPLAANLESARVLADDIPVAKTPDGGWKEFPSPVLAGCDEPLADGVPDLRGVWRAYQGPLKGHIERIEQAGNRVVITGGGVIHDMRADGTLEHGVNDAGAGGSAISVAARFERGRLNLYPGDRRVAVVTRYLDGEEMVWRWGPYRNRLRRLPGPGPSAQVQGAGGLPRRPGERSDRGAGP
ncbi:MAG: hypothetical protein ACE5EF_10435 [Dehalococcoidia bacterium]